MPPPFTVRAADIPGTDLGSWDHTGSITIPGNLVVGGTVAASQFGAIGDSLSGEVDQLDARVSALEAFNSGTPGLVYQYGAEANKGAAVLGNPIYFATDTGVLWVPGNGTWYSVALTAATLVSGGGNAPTNFSAVVNSDNTTSLAWTLPTPPTGYTISAVTVREKFNSPNGVSGMPLAGTATSNTRPAATQAGTREYYVTCTFSKAANPDIESAESAHVTTTYPFSGGGGGGGGLVTPASILGIGTANFFYLTQDQSNGVELTPTCAQLAAGYVSNPYFYVNATNDAVCMSTTANATTTQNSPHPRCEFREMMPDGTTKAAWTAKAGATHVMFGTSTITHLPADNESSSTPKPQVCFAQIHDASGDVVRLQVENSGSTPSDSPGGNSVANLHMVAHTHSPNGTAGTEVKTSIQSSYTIGSAINWKIEVVGTTCNIYIGGTITGTIGNLTYTGGTKKFSFTISGGGMYFKCGDYQQFSTYVTNSSGNPDGGYLPTSYAITELKNVSITHSSYA